MFVVGQARLLVPLPTADERLALVHTMVVGDLDLYNPGTYQTPMDLTADD